MDQRRLDAADARSKKILSFFIVTLFLSSTGVGLVMVADSTVAAPLPFLPTGAMDPGGVPHYFGPYANYANSPSPNGAITDIVVTNGGSGYSDPTVIIRDYWGTGLGASAMAIVSQGVIVDIQILSGGSGYTAPIVMITDPNGRDATATPLIGGDLQGGIRKFIDSLPGLGEANANNLGNYIPIAIPDITTYPGCDYYEIALVRYTQKMSTDLPATLMNGYVQLETAANYNMSKHVLLNNPDGSPILMSNGTQAIAVDIPSYLGPLIAASEDVPVRLTFYNLLPTGSGGDLFIPVDTTTMGAGMGPLDMMGMPGMKENYTENRATIHLHGGATPWISDGTPHQWTTPANEMTQYPKGVSVAYVPDMWFVNGEVVPGTVGNTTAPPGATNDPGDGALTFYYTNQQSARLMFYHDHAYGITRLNVYSGEAAPYLLTDAVENALIDSGIIPSDPGAYLYGIPLVIQDKTFVDASTIAYQDPTWAWGSNPGTPTTGDLWYPHVYMPNQNPYNITGANDFGRWDYGPWFFPPTDIMYGPVPNPYYDPVNAPWEPPMIPGVPNVSSTMEAFMDTPTVNGQAYPYLTIEPKAYRFRILNAANDRFFNLQWYVADPSIVTSDGRTGTEVNMVPAVTTPGYPSLWPTDGRAGGVPNPAYMGPAMIQIGTEGGFLPEPVVIPAQPITYNYNPKTFTYGNVQDHSLLLGSAERADVIVDFSQFAGKTLILYNDAPAGFPANDPRNDYYTGDDSQVTSGGAPTTMAGYGPNTRTIMQIRVADVAPAQPFDLNALMAAFSSSSDHQGVFESSQDPILVPQSGYNSAYGQSFSDNAFVRIQDTTMTFQTLNGGTYTIDLQPKAIHDEMGGAYDVVYGRMSGMLGLEVPSGTATTQMFIPLGYASPPVEILGDSMVPLTPVMGDGTQIWKITHNGVDTHAMHVHLFNIQLINRVGWDGAIYPPDANELGWKETVRVNPLSDTIVALRPVSPILPWEVPNSYRLIDPTLPEGDMLMEPPGGFFDPTGTGVTVTNHYVNYGWEYVWHCHLLEHEEMDMMHSMAIAVAPYAPLNLDGSFNITGVNLTWTDNSIAETGYTVQRNASGAGWVTIGTIGSPHATTGPTKGGTMYFNDTVALDGSVYVYRVLANSVVGDTMVYAGSIGFPHMSVNSTPSNELVVDTSGMTITPLPSGGGGPPVTPPGIPPVISYTSNFASLAAAMASNPKTSFVYANHAPIRIDSNADFDPAHGVSSGSGTAVDPWIIENFNIDGTGVGYGIYIGNTTEHFIVRNCRLTNATGNVAGWSYSPESGMVLFNVSNGTLANNIMSSNAWSGLYMRDSRDMLVFNETVSGSYIGIYMSSTNNSIVSYNTIMNNYAGAWLYGSNSNTMDNNTLVLNYPGVVLAGASYNTFSNSTFYANKDQAVIMHASGSNRVYSNDLIGNNGAASTYNAANAQAYDDNGTNQWNGLSKGNYWSDWTSPDTSPADGIVDAPYVIPGSIANDLYPLAQRVISDVLTSIQLTPVSASVNAGSSMLFIALGINQYGNVIPGTSMVWTTDVGSVVDGYFTAQTTAGTTGYVRAASGPLTTDSVVIISPGPLDHISVSPPVANVERGTSQQFTAVGQDVYNNAISGLVLVWTTDVGTVTSAGLFIAQNTAGVTGWVNATYGTVVGNAIVTVTAGQLTYVIVSPGTMSVIAGATQTFAATGYDQFGNELTGIAILWTTDIGTMTGPTLTAQTMAGVTGYVRATSGVVVGSATITIISGALDHIDVSPSGSISLVAGSQQQFSAVGRDQYENAISGLTFDWTTNVGTISLNGLLSAQNISDATGWVNATVGSVIGSTAVTVTFGQLTYIIVTPGTAEVMAGHDQAFTAEGYDQNNNPVTGLTFTWTTNVGVMTGPNLTAQTMAGKVGYVRAASGVVSGSAAITIVPGAIDHIDISPSGTLEMVAGTAKQFTATAKDVYNNTIPGAEFIWATDVGTVSESGSFVGHTLAYVTGNVTAGNGTIVGRVTIDIVPDQLAYIVVAPDSVHIAAGGSQEFSASGYDRYGNVIPGIEIAWTTNVGTMDGANLTAQTTIKDAGFVKATSGFVSGTASVNIVPAPLDHVSVVPSDLSEVVAGTEHQFTATGYDAYDNVVLGLVFTWDTDIGTVSDSGRFTAQTAAGMTGVVSATVNGTTGSVGLTVVPDQLTHIVVTPDSSDLRNGKMMEFMAVGYDQYNNSISGLVFIWDTNVGSMNGSVLKAMDKGEKSGFVSASSGLVTGFSTVKVSPPPTNWSLILGIPALFVIILVAAIVIWRRR